jgi:hypothetical protein
MPRRVGLGALEETASRADAPATAREGAAVIFGFRSSLWGVAA